LKIKLIFLLFIFSKTILGQNQEYKFKYVINSGTELILVDCISKKDLQSSSIQISISQNEQTLPFVKIKCQDSLKIYSAITNEEGVLNLKLPAGEYKLEVISPIFDNYIKVIQLRPNEELTLNFEVVNFEDNLKIYSKNTLSKEEIEAIKRCISKSSNKNNCFNNNMLITIEI